MKKTTTEKSNCALYSIFLAFARLGFEKADKQNDMKHIWPMRTFYLALFGGCSYQFYAKNKPKVSLIGH